MQPYFAPHLAYFQLLRAADRFVIYDDVQFIKGGWINRNRILVQGEPRMLTVPLSGASAHKVISEIGLSGGHAALLRTVRDAYARAPFRDETLAVLEEILEYADTDLADFAGRSVIRFAEHLGLTTRIDWSSRLDYDRSERGEERLLAMLGSLGASRYVNSSGGRALYDAHRFARDGIELRFLSPQIEPYPQRAPEFVPGLSIIDVLMSVGSGGARRRLEQYALD